MQFPLSDAVAAGFGVDGVPSFVRHSTPGERALTSLYAIASLSVLSRCRGERPDYNADSALLLALPVLAATLHDVETSFVERIQQHVQNVLSSDIDGTVVTKRDNDSMQVAVLITHIAAGAARDDKY